MKLIKKIWSKEWVKMMFPIYGEMYIFNQETGGHAYGYEKGFILVFTGIAKYGMLSLFALLISNLWR